MIGGGFLRKARSFELNRFSLQSQSWGRAPKCPVQHGLKSGHTDSTLSNLGVTHWKGPFRILSSQGNISDANVFQPLNTHPLLSGKLGPLVVPDHKPYLNTFFNFIIFALHRLVLASKHYVTLPQIMFSIWSITLFLAAKARNLTGELLESEKQSEKWRTCQKLWGLRGGTRLNTAQK